jgi:hypothetical protein
VTGLRFKKDGLWLLFPPVAFCLLDQAATLWGQSARYWDGDYLYVFEGNPIAYLLLAKHPFFYIIGSAAWIAVFCLLIFLLPKRLAIILCVFISFAHLWGTLGWIMLYSVVFGCCRYSPTIGYLVSVALILAASMSLPLALEKSGSLKWVQ